ncbi:thaumatin-like protein 1 [Ananas comosus]|uniref:Thaumatin-like protein 1 n=1 Tax=Ananas comosus TaxID=4615 RepID=A0A6P5EEG9_ANACO|nr:thaumatin-like protein 1 [Ananas comosus]
MFEKIIMKIIFFFFLRYVRKDVDLSKNRERERERERERVQVCGGRYLVVTFFHLIFFILFALKCEGRGLVCLQTKQTREPKKNLIHAPFLRGGEINYHFPDGERERGFHTLRLFLFFFLILLSGSNAATITITSQCNYTIWPVIWSNPGSPGFPNMFTSIKLRTTESKHFNIPHGSGWIWARTHCTNFGNSSSTFVCATGNCRTGAFSCGTGLSPPITFVELNIGPSGKPNGDAYQVSVAAGFNVPVDVTPRYGPDCSNAACATDINAVCPPELRVVRRAGGPTIRCMSGCQALGDEADCCLGRYWGPDKCRPTKFALMLKSLCPSAKSFVYENAFRYCSGGWEYLVTFCPEY